MLEVYKCLYFNFNINLNADSLLLPLWPVTISFKEENCQLIAAYYQIVFREDGVNSSIYINQMGLGKTVIAIFTYLLNGLIVVNKQAIQDS